MIQRTNTHLKKVFIFLSFLSYTVSTYIFVYNGYVFIFMHIISFHLHMLTHSVYYCIREKTNQLEKTYT